MMAIHSLVPVLVSWTLLCFTRPVLGQDTPASTSETTTSTASYCPAYVTLTFFATGSSTASPALTGPAYTTSAPASACTGTTAYCPCVSGCACLAVNPCTWDCVAVAASTSTFTTSPNPPSAATTTLVPPSSPSTTVPESASTQTAAPYPDAGTGTDTSSPPYEDNETSANAKLLPCVPGTFLCTSPTTWLTCDYNDGTDASASSTAMIYDYPRNVSAGTECITNISPYTSSTAQYAQQANVPAGHYRDDRIGRARPNGTCSDDGALECYTDGMGFLICDQGGWVDMGATAAGTECENGEIVASSSQ